MGNYFKYLESFAIIYDFAILKSLQDTQYTFFIEYCGVLLSIMQNE